MILQICAVRDSAVDAYGQPIFVKAIGEAIRSFGDEANRDGSPIKAHPADYELFHIGNYDDSTGTVAAHTPRSLGRGTDFGEK